MDISKRLMGASAICSPEGEVTDVDADGLVRRLLLFDKYVLVSVRLQEFPHLIRRLGYEGLRDLMFAKVIEIRCECLQLAEIGQTGMFGSKIQPLYTYEFNWLDAHDKPKYIEDALRHLESLPGLRNRQCRALQDEIRESIKPLPESSRMELWPDFRQETDNLSLLRASIQMALNKQLGRSDFRFTLTVHEEADGVFSVETDLAQLAGISDQKGHQLIQAGFMGIAGLSQAIVEMKAYSALSGFREDELPLYRKKIDYLASVLTSEHKEKQFQRVIEIADLPQFSAETDVIDIDKLLKVRNSNEAREFRDWLGTCGSANDSEIKDRVAGLRAKGGVKIAGPSGKALRFFVTTLLGNLSPPAGLVGGLLDTFLLEKVLPRSGVSAFINELYPSLFERRISEIPQDQVRRRIT
jgi:hypothetical protein